MNLFEIYILLYIFSLAYGNEHEDRRILSISKSLLKEIMDYKAKHDNRIRALEHKLRIGELKQDARIRKLEQDIRIYKLNQDDRIRKLEHTIKIQSKEIEDLNRESTYSKKDYTNLQVNDALVLSNMNDTVSETSDITAEEADSNELKHVHIRRPGKNENMEKCQTEKDFF
ncbi:unnamed protein product [Mytilus coruscus]|uniref:Uncharacterized protein n=1 Tax=Mytilus coruscus TaxID=42192 RepID=A0A6J8F0H7_MYTCO|nr:unnamed protein product [Mytilus coruscus]